MSSLFKVISSSFLSIMCLGAFTALFYVNTNYSKNVTKSNTSKVKFVTWQYWDTLQERKNYAKILKDLKIKQAIYSTQYKKSLPEKRQQWRDKVSKMLYQDITHKILPYWNETEWDFNGVSYVPAQGNIACGYFVATILQQAGIVLNRQKMGQSSSRDLVYALCDTSTVKTFRKKNFVQFWDYLSQKAPMGLYIVGLDKHTGLISKEADRIVFIHSRKPRLGGVIFEDAGKSLTLQNSGIQVIGNVLDNQPLLHKWLENEDQKL